MFYPFHADLARQFELTNATQNRMLPLEGLRGFAVFLVFLHHYSVQAQLVGFESELESGVAHALRSYGNLGVELFFLLSGYLIYGTLIHKAPPFAGFMMRRLQRILPTYVVVFTLSLALIMVMQVPDRIPREPLQALAYLAANLTLVAGLLPISRIVDVSWSLSYELFLYAATGLLVLGFGLGSMRSSRRVAVVAFLACAFLLMTCSDAGGFPVRAMPFFAGMLLAEGLGKRVPAWLAWAGLLAGFVASVTHAFPGAAGELVQTVAFFLLCAVCFRGDGRISACMAWTPLRWLGNMSYSYYLAHGLIVRCAMLCLGYVLPHGLPAWLFWTLIPVLFAVTSIGSAMLFLLVEKPMSLRPASSEEPRAAQPSEKELEAQRPDDYWAARPSASRMRGIAAFTWK